MKKERKPNVASDIGYRRKKPAADGGETSYTVVSGDCLWNISYHFYGAGAKFTRIASANGLKPPYLINIGQVLVIPAA